MESNRQDNLDVRDIQELYKAFQQADNILMKKYQNDLTQYPIGNFLESILDGERDAAVKEKGNRRDQFIFDLPYRQFQLFQINRIVYDQSENVQDKLTSVYNAISAYPGSAILMIIISDGTEARMYCGTAYRGPYSAGERVDRYNTLLTAMRSNFPGIGVTPVKVNGDSAVTNGKLMQEIFQTAKAVSSVSGVAARRNDKTQKNEEFVQGMEKLVESMRGRRCTALWIAECVNTNEAEALCADYADIYSQLYPFLQSQQTISRSTGSTETESQIKGVTKTTNSSISNAVSHGTSAGFSSGSSVGGNAGLELGPVKFGGNYSRNWGTSINTTKSKTKTKTTGTAKSLTEQNSVAKALTVTSSDGLQLTFHNRAVKNLLDRIDEQIKRLRACEDFGIYNLGAYFIARSVPDAVAVAATYQALIRGDKSSVETSAVNTWHGDDAKVIMEYLKRMHHPQFVIPHAGEDAGEKEAAWLPVTPASFVSGRELPIHIGLPKKSIPGVTVVNCAEFGREAIRGTDPNAAVIPLGTIMHMRAEEKQPVSLDRNSFSSHAFITGSTGAGKSNTVYTILDELTKSGQVHFLVIEPAKGEYKDVFGGRRSVSVYGSNPRKTPLLRLNPFSFPEDIHVLEHIDRLVEIFNACWPMYAAMPAVLKDAVEEIYRKAGWDMTQSVNSQGYFPTFLDLLEELPKTIRKSNYSSDTQSDYTGALVTRVKSLTNGIIGQIFCSKEELTGEQLFDQDVIVDLSRIGSSETKSLLMGLLTMKLQEHRMAQGGMNSDLKHITVLEEAHNLLRRTSSEQSQESSNLQGKSVEMIANAIAEMRTYGEGFIIADQSPGLMDMSVIRNTNTKIIMRLPDESDRQLVGKAAALNKSQIEELARLPKGVAAIYQNDWIEPVLCKVKHFKKGEYRPFDTKGMVDNSSTSAQVFFSHLIHPVSNRELSKETVDSLHKWIDRLNVAVEAKDAMRRSLEGNFSLQAELLFNLFDGWHLTAAAIQSESSNAFALDEINREIRDLYQLHDLTLAEEIRKIIFNRAIQNPDKPEIRAKLEELERAKGGLL